MRSLVFPAILLSAVAAAAQINLSDEVVSTPLRARLVPVSIAAPAVTVAKDNSGVAIAWTMSNGAGADRVYVTRLNDAAQAGAVREIPLSSAAVTVHEAFPSLAPSSDGKGFILAWMEIDPALPKVARLAFCRLDAALTPSAPAVLFETVFSTWPALARTKGDTTWIAGGGFIWPLSKDGTLGKPLPGLGASDMTIGTDVPQLVSSHRAQSTSFTCLPFCGPCFFQCRVFGADYALDFMSLFTANVSDVFKFTSDAKPAIASNGKDVFVAWFRGTQTDGGEVVATHLAPPQQFFTFAASAEKPMIIGSFLPDSGETRADIAVDADSYVVVWRVTNGKDNHDINGVMVDEKNRLTPFSIATSSADERDPAILALGGGNFLVAYEKVSGTERRIAGRVLSFGRHRAAR